MPKKWRKKPIAPRKMVGYPPKCLIWPYFLKAISNYWARLWQDQKSAIIAENCQSVSKNVDEVSTNDQKLSYGPPVWPIFVDLGSRHLPCLTNPSCRRMLAVLVCCFVWDGPKSRPAAPPGRLCNTLKRCIPYGPDEYETVTWQDGKFHPPQKKPTN